MLDWPLENALGAIHERLRAEAREEYRHQQMLFAQGGLEKAPELPELLREQAGE